MQKRMNLRLFEPGMTQLHRVGLAGLYMTLKQLDPAEFEEFGGWSTNDYGIDFFWRNTPKQLFEPIMDKSFGINKDGLIDFLVHRRQGLGDFERVQMHHAILKSFLQHGRTRKISKTTTRLSFEYEGKNLHVEIAPMASYQNRSIDNLFNKKGTFPPELKLAGWAFPGGGVRHVGFPSQTILTNNHEKFLCLLYAPVASLYFLISCKNSEGKFDKRKGAAIVLPHLKNLEKYHSGYQNYLLSPVEKLHANSLGDAGLSALTALNLHQGMLRDLEIDSCTVITLGTIPWAKQQKTRTAIEQMRAIDRKRLSFFHTASQIFKHKIIIKEDETYYIRTSTVRGLVAENIAADRPWFHDFNKIMKSKSLARDTTYEKRGLHAMIHDSSTDWPYEEDKLFVVAIHTALRNRYGALAARATAKGERIPFDREFEKIRTSLMRVKNAQTMRAEIADLFARGGINKELQQNWAKLLALFTGPDWQKTRDLALLALASYAGKGAEQVLDVNTQEIDNNENNGEGNK